MRFTLEPEVEAFREELRTWLETAIDPVIPFQGPQAQMDTPEKTVFVRKLADRGLLGLTWPVEYGGRGLEEIYQLVLQEELEYAHMPSLNIEVGMIGETILRHGSEEQKQAFLPRIVRGDISMALGYSEPQAGSDLGALELRAVRSGDHFVLNGQKIFTSAAHFADVIWLACRTNPTAPKHNGISLMLVDMASPGIEVSPIATMGDEHLTNSVFFTDVEVPASRLVGELDRGWQYLMEALDYERLRGLPIGGLQRDLDELIAWARADENWADPRVRDLVAQASVQVEAVRSHLARSLDLLSRHEVPTFEATMFKIAVTEARQDLADTVIDLLGPSGVLRRQAPTAPMQGRFEHNWRSEIITTIAGGANEIQRNILARRHLRLPGP